MSLRDLTIKTGVLKRVLKDETYYKQEAKDQEARIAKLKAENGDAYVIRKQVRRSAMYSLSFLDETLNMIPDCKRRIAQAIQDLKALVDENQTTFSDTKELKDAQEVLGSIEYDD
ncbi:hypothetical protein IWQ60_004142 [Tieghemiomyces parasiticus]|uniref:Tubulin-specific chaperone A n=1 Tax=Tieghemiomyces parasiticus TaxID=78921 RepID=A0A9W8E022_9FUNG|nr:hypothetical protein IWQ60_004142 [Tieghemiomyces parasiticus]